MYVPSFNSDNSVLMSRIDILYQYVAGRFLLMFGSEYIFILHDLIYIFCPEYCPVRTIIVQIPLDDFRNRKSFYMGDE